MTPVVRSSGRRYFLKAATAAGLLGALQRGTALAQGAPDYKALVCVFLQGGNDGENMLVRVDSQGYNNTAPFARSSGINIPQGQLLPIQPARGGPPFGFHPACGGFKTPSMQASSPSSPTWVPCRSLRPEPPCSPKCAASAQSVLASWDQESALQSADVRGATRVGWAGRAADRIEALAPGLFPSAIAINRLQTFVTRPDVGPACRSRESILLSLRYPRIRYDTLREAAMRELLSEDFGDLYSLAAQRFTQDGLSASSVMQPILSNRRRSSRRAVRGTRQSVANQLRSVALLIEGRAQINLEAADLPRQSIRVRHAWRSIRSPTTAVERPLAGDRCIPACDERACRARQRDDFHAFRDGGGRSSRPPTEVPTTAGATMAPRDRRRGERRRLLWNSPGRSP